MGQAQPPQTAETMVVTLNIIDFDGYRRNRAEIAPLWAKFGGSILFEAKISAGIQVAKTGHNYLLVIRFESPSRRKDLFSDERYKAAKKRFFDPAVSQVDVLTSVREIASPLPPAPMPETSSFAQ